MRNGQNKRMRGGGGGGRNNNNQQQQHHHHRKNHNPLSRVYESNGPDVKIRGNPSHIAEKYAQLARDAQSSGDPVSAENYYQHAEHYNRLIAAAQEQFRQNNPQFNNRPEQDLRSDLRDDAFDDDMDDNAGQQQPMQGGGNDGNFGNRGEPFGTREPQPYLPREAQPFPQQQHNQQQPQHNPQQHNQQQQPPRPQQQHGGPQHGGPQHVAEDVGGLPSFITGGQPPQGGQQPNQNNGSNGHDNNSPDRFPLHRRRRRHRGPRPDFQGGPRQADDTQQD